MKIKEFIQREAHIRSLKKEIKSLEKETERQNNTIMELVKEVSGLKLQRNRSDQTDRYRASRRGVVEDLKKFIDAEFLMGGRNMIENVCAICNEEYTHPPGTFPTICQSCGAKILVGVIKESLLQKQEGRVGRAIQLITKELDRAEKLHPEYPDNQHERLGIITEELGELSQAINDSKWGGMHAHKVLDEAVHVAATALRFIINYKREAKDGV